MKMVADVYSHIIDDDRKKNAQKFEEEFYAGRNTWADPTSSKQCSVFSFDTLLKIMQNPEAAELLKALVKNL